MNIYCTINVFDVFGKILEFGGERRQIENSFKQRLKGDDWREESLIFLS